MNSSLDTIFIFGYYALLGYRSQRCLMVIWTKSDKRWQVRESGVVSRVNTEPNTNWIQTFSHTCGWADLICRSHPLRCQPYSEKLYKVITDLEHTTPRRNHIIQTTCLWRTRAYGYSEISYCMLPFVPSLVAIIHSNNAATKSNNRFRAHYFIDA